MKLESNARDVLCLIVGAQATAGLLILGTLLITGWQKNNPPRIEIDSRVTLKPDGEIKVPIKVETAPAQVTVQQIPVDRVQVPDVKIENKIQPAEVKIQMPGKPIDVNVVNLTGLGMPASAPAAKKPSDPFGEILPEPVNKDKK
jgi:hypothetical protein